MDMDHAPILPSEHKRERIRCLLEDMIKLKATQRVYVFNHTKLGEF
jgi:hypothetical protein